MSNTLSSMDKRSACALRIRRVKEARNKLHKKPLSRGDLCSDSSISSDEIMVTNINSSFVSPQPPMGVADLVKDKEEWPHALTRGTSILSEPAQHEPLVHTDTLYVVISVDRALLYNTPDGVYYSSGAEELELVALFNNFVLVEPSHDIKYVHDHGEGWYKISSDATLNMKRYLPRPSSILLTVGAYTSYLDVPPYTAMHHYAESFVVYQPLLKELRAKFSNIEVNRNILQGVFAYSDKAYPCNPFNIVIHHSTAQYFINFMHHRDHARVNTDSNRYRLTGNNGLIREYPAETLSNIGQQLRLQQLSFAGNKVLLQVAHATCDLIKPWLCRDDVRITLSGGAYLDVNGHPNFVDTVAFKPTSYNTTFFAFKGTTEFCFYQVKNPINVCKGLYRLLHARLDEPLAKMLRVDPLLIPTLEDEYRLNSLGIAYNLHRILVNSMDEPTLIKGFMRLKGLRWGGLLSYDPRSTTQGSKLTLSPWLDPKNCKDHRQISKMNSDCALFIASQLSTLLQCVSRSTVDAWYDSIKTTKTWAYAKLHLSYTTYLWPLASREQCAQIPHLKRLLRQKYVNGIMCHEDAMPCKLIAHVKGELSKHGKFSRLFVDYGSAVMEAPQLPEFVKKCINGEHYFSIGSGDWIVDVVIWIMSASISSDLETIFNKLYDVLSMKNTIFGVIYSDDMCIAGNIKGKPFCYNVDISSNDSSQDMAAFYPVYVALCKFCPERAYSLIEQCMQPINCPNPIDATQNIELRFEGPFEGSGTTLTTILNHFGSFQIVVAFAYGVFSTHGTCIESAVVSGARAVGHEVTIDDCFGNGELVFERVQFLKRSPVFDGVRWKPSINIGCILRSFGTVVGDLTCDQLGLTTQEFGSLSNIDRADLFFGSVIEGWKHEIGNPVLRALRTRFSRNAKTIIHESLIHVITAANYGSENSVTLDSSFAKRYDLETHELQELVEAIRCVSLGDIFTLPALTKIFHRDYGLPLTPSNS